MSISDEALLWIEQKAERRTSRLAVVLARVARVFDIDFGATQIRFVQLFDRIVGRRLRFVRDEREAALQLTTAHRACG